MPVKDSVSIVNGRIGGTRITVYDVHYYRRHGRTSEEIVEILSLTPCQLDAAYRYIDEHLQEVEALHALIEARNAAGNTAEVEAKRAASRTKLKARLARGSGEA